MPTQTTARKNSTEKTTNWVVGGHVFNTLGVAAHKRFRRKLNIILRGSTGFTTKFSSVSWTSPCVTVNLGWYGAFVLLALQTGLLPQMLSPGERNFCCCCTHETLSMNKRQLSLWQFTSFQITNHSSHFYHTLTSDRERRHARSQRDGQEWAISTDYTWGRLVERNPLKDSNFMGRAPLRLYDTTRAFDLVIRIVSWAEKCASCELCKQQSTFSAKGDIHLRY